MQLGSAPEPSEANAETDTGIVDALVLFGQAGIGDMVEKGRNLVDRGNTVTQFEGLAEQHVGAEALAVGRTGSDVAVIEPGAEKDAEGQTVIGPQNVADKQPAPGRSEIILVGVFAGVEFGADRSARLQRPTDIARQASNPGIADRRGKDHLGIDINPVLLASRKVNIVVENAKLKLAVSQVLGVRDRRREDRCRGHGGEREQAPTPLANRRSTRSVIRDHLLRPRKKLGRETT